nr:glycosyltransferase [uncultured Gellertiella sp.]
MADAMTAEPHVAVLIPCYNEAATIGAVVEGFRAALPEADIFVFDNNSTDGTALKAMLAGATVHTETRQGKGHVVRRMFADIEADIYLMADGDGTYSPADAGHLITELVENRADMVVGTRRGVHDDAGRQGHAFGNRIFNTLYRAIFGTGFSDIFSGYRAFSRRFAKTFPAVSAGFEIETEMSVHVWRLKLPVSEIELDYGRRPEGSHSKLSTFRDGAKILWMFAMLMKETRPFTFFGLLCGLFLATSALLMGPILIEYWQTGLVPRQPTWILSMALLMISFMLLTAGTILDSLARARAEQMRLYYNSMPRLGTLSRPTATERPKKRIKAA